MGADAGGPRLRELLARLGLGERSSRPPRSYTQPMGLRAGLQIDKALHLTAALEDEEIIRKLELRK